jgi:hypothetical protein
MPCMSCMVQINFQLTIQGIQEIQEKPNANYWFHSLKHNKKWVKHKPPTCMPCMPYMVQKDQIHKLIRHECLYGSIKH